MNWYDIARKQVEKFNARVPVITINISPPASVERQGTRASASQGTSSQANTPDPLDPSRPVSGKRHAFTADERGWDDPVETPPIGIFSTDDPAYNSAPGNTVQVDRWPPNPSKEVIAPSIGHTEQIRTDRDLQLGPGPGRIDRWMPLRVFGVANGMTTGVRGGEGFPWNADMSHIDHLPVARQALGTKGPQKLADDNVPVPAVYAGNPR